MRDLERLNRARQGHALSALGLPVKPIRFWQRQVSGALSAGGLHAQPVGNKGKPLYDTDPASPTYGVRRCIVGIDPADATDCVWF